MCLAKPSTCSKQLILYKILKKINLEIIMEDFPKSIKVKIFYDESLQKITNKDFEETIISEGLSFVMFLYFIFSSYPEIQKEFPLGKLRLLLNNRKPNDSDILDEGDEVKLIDCRKKRE